MYVKFLLHFGGKFRRLIALIKEENVTEGLDIYIWRMMFPGNTIVLIRLKMHKDNLWYRSMFFLYRSALCYAVWVPGSPVMIWRFFWCTSAPWTETEALKH